MFAPSVWRYITTIQDNLTVQSIPTSKKIFAKMKLFLIQTVAIAFAVLSKISDTAALHISTTCSNDTQCITLMDCLTSIVPLPCFESNQITQLKSGNHTFSLLMAQIYLIEQKSNLTIKGTDKTIIDCRETVSFVFANISGLIITDVGFTNCGVSIHNALVEQINHTIKLPLPFLPGQKVGILLINISNLSFDKVQVNYSIGYGVIGMNLLGYSRIDNSFFGNNNIRVQKDFLENKLDCTKSDQCNGGNALFLYADSKDKTTNDATLIISKTTFTLGSNFIKPTIMSSYTHTSKRNLTAGAGISLLLLQMSYEVNFVFRDSTSISNKAFTGANIHINIFNDVMNSSILIDNIQVASSNNYFNYKVPVIENLHHDSVSGGGLYYEYGNKIMTQKNKKIQYLKYNVTFRNINFFLNTAMNGGGAFIKLHLSPTNQYLLQHVLTMDKCTFTDNRAFYGAGLYINELQYEQIFDNQPSIDDVFICYITNTVFDQQTILLSSHQSLVETGISSSIFLNGIHGILLLQNVTVKNSKHCTGLLLIDSTVGCNGIRIENNLNSANGGGAILIGQSCFILYPNSTLTIANNTAQGRHGGGLYIPTIQPYTYQPLCFFQVLPKSAVSSTIQYIGQYNASIEFINNTAQEGHDIYGGDLERCFLLFWDVETKRAYKNFVKIDSNQTSTVTSFAQTICFCFDGKEDCSVDNYLYNNTVYPGQIFSISAVPVGQLNGVTSTESVKVSIPDYAENDFSMLDKSQLNKLQSLKNVCDDLKFGFKVDSNVNGKQKLFHLLIDGEIQRYYWKTVTFNFASACPIFFHHNNKSGTCECSQLLKKFKITCDESEAYIERNPASYIGYHNKCMYVYTYCPIDRCSENKTKLLSLDLKQDEQCVNNRKGLMCGECMDGHSRILGSNDCWKCQNTNLLIILFFAVAGIVLVWGISFLNLTVSTGTINGIIFYANIVKVNRDIFYPKLSKHNPLTLLIAWINLDFGIEMCLFDGMNEFHKTLIQFVFPVYLWFLSLLAVYLSRHYRIMRKILGKNCTPALATILLLSFTKLLDIVSRIFSPIQLSRECDDGKVTVVLAWWSDATIPFLGAHHMILMTIGSIVTLFAIIPFALLLVTSPFLERLNHYKILRWVARLKPFLDAYKGPYHESSQYWTGFLLFIRLGLMFAFALNTYGYKNLQLFLVILVSIILLLLTVYGKGIYRSKISNYLEAMSIVNLAIYSVTVQFLLRLPEKENLKADKYVSMASLSIIAIEVIMIILFQSLVTLLTVCGIVEETNIKEWFLNLYRLPRRHAWLGKLSRSGSKYINYNNSFTKDSLSRRFYADSSECSTDVVEDSWNISIRDYREPLLDHIS